MIKLILLALVYSIIYALRVTWKGLTKPYDRSGVDNYFANKQKDIPKPKLYIPKRKKKIVYTRSTRPRH